MRTLRSQVEGNIKQKIRDNPPIMAWFVRWAVELISKYTIADDGKSPYERIRQDRCVTPLVPFGETVLYLPLKKVRRSKGDTAMKCGIWLGVIERIEEVLVGTRQGVVKCRAVTRLLDGEKWRADVIESMKGLPWEPVIGRQSATTPVAIQENGDVIAYEAEAK